MKVGTKVFSSIQLVEDVSYGRNINSIERNATKAPSEKLVEHVTNMKLVKSIVEPLPLRKPRCENPGDSNGNKSKLWQVRAETSCQQDVPTSATVQVKRRRKLRQRF
ncbi:hypothetical protein Golax_009637 [Gossypium laxum]|uniref:Uncharacterized protein n=1 Tax=Gossypium laxum TaxID=34288 RepID=A0A7J9ADL1_9ROSI|nr:hypothetical protein [Gossypium laxum]